MSKSNFFENRAKGKKEPLDPQFDVKEQIRDAIDIVELVSRYVPSLRRQGRLYTGRCPWHDDSRPSLQVNPERQTFKCWVCDIGGDIFTFVEKIENVGFREALEILADMAGVPLPSAKEFRKDQPLMAAQSSAQSGGAEARGFVPEPIAKPVLYRAMDWLCGVYHRFFLEDAEAQGARDYIRGRGISDEMIRRFRIGYAPLKHSALIDIVGADRNRVAILEAAGVLTRRPDSILPAEGALTAKLSPYEAQQYSDRFRGRVLFPIRDTQDRTVAFGGRLLPETPLKSPAKYVNSPETPIFTKSKMLYGLDMARNSIRKKKRVIVTEGYTDCLMAHQFGFDETVAVLGTALGEYHIKVLNRFADRIYLILDGDEAGQKRTNEVLNLFVAQGADMSILTLPNNQDPCEFLLAEGAEAFERKIQHESVDALDHAFRTATRGIDLENDLVASARALDQLIETIALFPGAKVPGDPARIRIEKMIGRLALRFRIKEDEIRRRLGEFRRQHQSRRRAEPLHEEAPQAAQTLRQRFVLPISDFQDESDESVMARFGKISVDIWRSPSLLPTALEKEYLQFWLTRPDLFGRLSAALAQSEFYSPITRQLTLLGNDLLERGISPDFSQLLLRYEDPGMKNYLVDLDAQAREMRLAEQLTEPSACEQLLSEIVHGFERQKLDASTPGTLSDLREGNLAEDQKLSKLIEFQEKLRQRQQQIGNNVPMDGDEPIL